MDHAKQSVDIIDLTIHEVQEALTQYVLSKNTMIPMGDHRSVVVEYLTTPNTYITKGDLFCSSMRVIIADDPQKQKPSS